MTLVATRRPGLFPSVMDDLLDADRIVLPNLFDFDGNFNSMLRQVPSVNIVENDRDYKIDLAAPGLEKKDFKIEVDKNLLTISSEKENEEREEKKNFSRREFSYSAFSRSFTLPENALPEKIDAKYENGVLTLTLPKKEVTVSKPKKEIKVS